MGMHMHYLYIYCGYKMLHTSVKMSGFFHVKSIATLNVKLES